MSDSLDRPWEVSEGHTARPVETESGTTSIFCNDNGFQDYLPDLAWSSDGGYDPSDESMDEGSFFEEDVSRGREVDHTSFKTGFPLSIMPEGETFLPSDCDSDIMLFEDFVNASHGNATQENIDFIGESNPSRSPSCVPSPDVQIAPQKFSPVYGYEELFSEYEGHLLSPSGQGTNSAFRNGLTTGNVIAEIII